MRSLIYALLVILLSACTAVPAQDECLKEYRPLVRVVPEYPVKALADGVTGWVTLEFTVSTKGRATDIELFDESPPNLFTQAAIHALEQFKFEPRVVDCEVVDAVGMRRKFNFDVR